MKISEERKEGLNKISKNGIFTITALDHRESLKKIINPKNPNSVSFEDMRKIKSEFIRIFSPYSSGLILDTEIGIKACPDRLKTGLLISIEKSGYKEGNGRITELITSVNEIKRMGDVVKLLIYYNPDRKSSKKQFSLVKNVFDDCIKYEIPLACEILTYDIEDKESIIVGIAKKFSKVSDILKLEFPGEIDNSINDLLKNCRDVDNASKVPWVVLSRGVGYEIFKKQVEIAIRSGASGFMAGRALWKDWLKDKNEKECVDRLKNLCKIAENGVKWYER